MPSFIVETSAESLPFSERGLYDILSRAASADQVQIKTAAQQLQNWEHTKGYYSGLQSIFADTSLPLNIRHLAIISLKNGVDKYWRKTAQNALSKEEKAIIRSRCIQTGLQEPDQRLAVQNALVIAKIVRFEFPHEWPDALPSIAQGIDDYSNSNTVALSRILLIALYVIKQLSTAMIQRSRMSLYKTAPQLTKALAKAYLASSRWIDSSPAGEADDLVDQNLLALRALRRLLVSGYERPHDEHEIHEIWALLQKHFGTIFALVSRNEGAAKTHMQYQAEKHLLQISKLHLQMIQKHPISFPQLPDSIPIARSYWDLILRFSETFGAVDLNAQYEVGSDGDIQDEVRCLEKLSLKGLLLLRACVKTAYYPVQTFKYLLKAEKEERNHWVKHLRTSFFSEALVTDMMQVLVTRFFVFRPSDLREWETEPDEWVRVQEGEGEAWEHSVRVCSEKLFLDLVLNNKAVLIQPLLSSFHAVANQECKDVRLKDSVYGAIGLSAAVLDKELDFNKFMSETLVPEVQIQASPYRMLRRRIAIMLEQWSQVTQLDRRVAYQIFTHLLNPSDPINDHVVRVTAARQLRFFLDQWNCSVDEFVPYSTNVIDHLIGLIPEVTLEETKLAVLNTMQVIVERMGRKVSPLTETIVGALSDLWARAGTQSLRKNTILDLLKTLVDSLNELSHQWHGLVIPLVERCVDPAANDYHQLVEDGVNLWLAVVVNAETPTPELMGLTRCLIPLYDVGLEVIESVLELTQAYILLAPALMIQQCKPLLAELSRMLQAKSIHSEPRHQIHRTIELQLQLAQSACTQEQFIAYVAELTNSGILPHILEGLKSVHEANQYSGPSPPAPLITVPDTTDYLCILSRLAYASPQAWVDSLTTGEDATQWVLELWFDHFNSLSTATVKKLNCFGLTNLLSLTPGQMPRLQHYMTIWTETCLECCEELPPSPDYHGQLSIDKPGHLGRDTLVWQAPGPWTGPEDERPKPGDRRNTQLEHEDPVHSFSITALVTQSLRKAIDSCGGDERFRNEWLVNVDKEVVNGFIGLGIT